MPDNSSAEIDFLTPEQAEPLLQAEAEAYIADGWQFAYLSNYVLRLKKDVELLDIQIDLQGQITVEQKRATQTSLEYGRLWAWIFLWLFLILAILFAELIDFI